MNHDLMVALLDSLPHSSATLHLEDNRESFRGSLDTNLRILYKLFATKVIENKSFIKTLTPLTTYRSYRFKKPQKYFVTFKIQKLLTEIYGQIYP